MAANQAARAATGDKLTENEGSLLALVLRVQPVTAYQLLKTYEQSPTSTINSSKGSVYPMIRRLKAQRLLAAKAVEGDRRRSEVLSCTEVGEAAVRAWIGDLRQEHALPGDPLRSRLQSLDLLSPDEQTEWIHGAKAMLVAKMKEVEAYSETTDVPYPGLVRDNAMTSLQTRFAWLDRVFFELVSTRGDGRPAKERGAAR